MLDGPLVFVDVDTQRDFLDPSGALYVPGSVLIRPNLRRLTEFALAHQVPILATTCSHLPDDPELALFPPHCMAGTPGQEIIPETAVEGTVVLPPEKRLSGEPPLHLTLPKRELDVFSRPDADELIARYNQAQPTFVVYGVATEYCVKAAADGFLKRGCRVVIVVDAVRAIDPALEPDLLTDFARRGALLTVTEIVCRDSAP
jgi:nicotinamidase/pyrazinamidase